MYLEALLEPMALMADAGGPIKTTAAQTRQRNQQEGHLVK